MLVAVRASFYQDKPVLEAGLAEAEAARR